MQIRLLQRGLYKPFSAILLFFNVLMFSFLQVCKFTDLQVHNSKDCPYFYGLSVKISDLLHLLINMHTHNSIQNGGCKNILKIRRLEFLFLFFDKVAMKNRYRGSERLNRWNQDSSPTRQLTDTVFETIHRQILRQLTDTL